MRDIKNVIKLCLLETKKMEKKKEEMIIRGSSGKNSINEVIRACLLLGEIPEIERQIQQELAAG